MCRLSHFMSTWIDPLNRAYREMRRSVVAISRTVVRWLWWFPLGYYLFDSLPIERWVESHFHKLLPPIGLPNAFVLTALLVLVRRMYEMERVVNEQIERSRRFWTFSSREEAYSQICKLIHEHPERVKRVELLQFSGDTAIAILKAIAAVCPHAYVRLFLVPEQIASSFDEPGFHWTRVQHTIGAVRVIHEDYSTFNCDIFSYEALPSIAGVLIDDWLASAGWYHMAQRDDSRKSIRGHASPAFVGIDDAAHPLKLMVQQQIRLVEHKATLAFSTQRQSSKSVGL